ncbi:hypothetical protein CROQUDRAFT_653089 [Cronartium quercuum f. sp. fusiforme G11]|uniref:Uncharacterized protein n=1 Tax=Cronartium quercuum f. sp. fusiforme G11 TaxID=708437 RepID=A0A9P6TEX0_9BASI|nr:hypothetical protein CROQUDRAFT_653089 [Cronartium quercuum f. sp. fusiforme G11]
MVVENKVIKKYQEIKSPPPKSGLFLVDRPRFRPSSPLIFHIRLMIDFVVVLHAQPTLPGSNHNKDLKGARSRGRSLCRSCVPHLQSG